MKKLFAELFATALSTATAFGGLTVVARRRTMVTTEA
jgi:hypothetical protein